MKLLKVFMSTAMASIILGEQYKYISHNVAQPICFYGDMAPLRPIGCRQYCLVVKKASQMRKTHL